MLVDLNTVDASEVNTYLLNEVLRPVLAGKEICYGDIDYSQFCVDDINDIAEHYEKLYRVANKLKALVGSIADANPAACKHRAFC